MNPSNLHFSLYAPDSASTDGQLITIRYPFAQAFKIHYWDIEDDKAGELAIPTDWDHEAKTWHEVTGRYCGENRFEGVINRLQFWMVPGCELRIMPRDAIMLAVRLEFTFEEFFARGGITTFVDRMAASIGLHRADIKVVQVYEGSTIIDFEVIRDLAAEVPIVFEDVIETFESVMSTSTEFMGSVILDVSSSADDPIIPQVEDVVDLLWPDDGIPFDLQPATKEEEQVVVKVEYGYSKNDQQSLHKKGASKIASYFVIFLCLSILALVILAIVVCVINRFARKGTELKIIDQTAQLADDSTLNGTSAKIEMYELDKQYTPGKDAEVYATGRGYGVTPRRRTTQSKLIATEVMLGIGQVGHHDSEE